MKLIIYTGTGEGKTSAAAGHALRALSHDLRVIVFQYLKPATDSEFTYLSSVSPLTLVKLSNITKFCDFSNIDYNDFYTHAIILKICHKNHDIIIFDEINILFSHNNNKKINDFLAMLTKYTNKNTIVIFTGRLNAEAFKVLYNHAIIVTDFIENKHEFNNNEFYKIMEGVDY